MMKDVKKGTYPLFGVTALAGCRPLALFNTGAATPGAAAQQQQQGGAGGSKAAQAAQELEQELAPRVKQEPQTVKQQMQQPIGGWW